MIVQLVLAVGGFDLFVGGVSTCDTELAGGQCEAILPAQER